MPLLRRLLVITCALIAAVTPVKADDNQWVEADGQCALIGDITFDQAWLKALNQARSEAIAQVTGQNVSHLFSTVTSPEGRQAFSVGMTETSGRIVEEQILTTSVHTERPSGTQTPPAFVMLRLRAHVLNDGAGDTGFKLRLALQKSNVQEGEPLQLTVESSQSAHLTVLNLAADGRIYVLYPNRFVPDLTIAPGQYLVLPKADDGFEIRPRPIPGHTVDLETIKVVATRQQAPLIHGTDQGLSLSELTLWLMTIPRLERTEATATYQVFANR